MPAAARVLSVLLLTALCSAALSQDDFSVEAANHISKSPGQPNWISGVCLVKEKYYTECQYPPPGPEPKPYCCATSCPIPVPEPPTYGQLPPAPATTPSGQPVITGTQAQVDAIFDGNRRQAQSRNMYPNKAARTRSPGRSNRTADAQGYCSAGLRQPVTQPGPPAAQGAVKLFMHFRYQSLPPTCGFTLPEPSCAAPGGCGYVCSGNTLSNGLILAAAHCFDENVARLSIRGGIQGYPTVISNDPCGINNLPITLLSVAACYDYPQTGRNPMSICPKNRRYVANSVSYYPRPPLTSATTLFEANDKIVTAPYDQAVVFLAQPVMHLPPAAFYKYNYRDNYPGSTVVDVENWSYIGQCGSNPPDDAAGPCPTPVPCSLSHIGPARLTPPTTFGETPGADAIRMPMTSFGGNSGSCALNTPDSCCYAVSSFGIPTCRDTCESWWSPIMSEKPLSALWATRQVLLPAP